MTRVKVSGKFSSSQEAGVALVCLSGILGELSALIVGPIENDVWLPIYCLENVKPTVQRALSSVGSVETIIEPV